ncbi:MAG: COX15/CtaA family protein [Dehalococcoidia bacterium]
MTRFQRLSLATTVALYFLVVLGGTVRVTNSGLSCLDWPKCNGSLLPSANGHVLVEYAHRFVVFIVSWMIVAIVVTAWRSYRRDRAILAFASALLGVLIVQIGLGGATVTQKLSPEIVTAHLGTAMLLFATSILLTLVSFRRSWRLAQAEPDNEAGVRRFRTVAFVTAAGMYLLLLTGAYTASSGAGTSCSTWPLCNGQVIPHGTRFVEINFLHRVVVVAVSLALGMLMFGARRWLRENRVVKRVVLDTFVFFLVQVALGAFNVWTKLLTPVRVAHLATGAALWAELVAVAWMAYTVVRMQVEPAAEPRAAVRGATRRSQEAAS